MRINNPGSPYAELYQLNGPYLLTHEDFDFQRNSILISVIGPGFTQHHGDSLDLSQMMNRLPHQHAFFELMFVVKGTVLHQIEDKKHICKAGQCVLLNHYVRHVEAPEENTELFFLSISDALFSQIIQADIRFDENGHIVPNENPIYDFVAKTQKTGSYQKQYWYFIPTIPENIIVSIFEDLFGKLIIESNERHSGFLLMVQSLIARISSYLVNTDYFSCQKVILHSDQEEYLFLRIQDILAKTHGRISRKDLSAQMNYSPDYLNKIVKKRANMSLLEYGRIYTCKEAARLLSQTTLSITGITHQLGFSNRSHFYEMFKEHYGVTPNEYRGEKNQCDVP